MKLIWCPVPGDYPIKVVEQADLENASYLTANRPTENLYVGMQIFDIDLGIPIFYNGTAWVNASGTVV